MPRFLRYLRIAFSATCGIACVLVYILWVRSPTWNDVAYCPYRGGELILLQSNRGTVSVSFGGNSRLFPSGWGRFSLPVSNMRGFARPPWSYSAGTYTEVTFPHWFPALVSGTLAAVPWATHIKWRFSLRTLLIATTLVAMVLGLIVYAARS
jgi:hypothetical protein